MGGIKNRMRHFSDWTEWHLVKMDADNLTDLTEGHFYIKPGVMRQRSVTPGNHRKEFSG
jgi:hypothetical protein